MARVLVTGGAGHMGRCAVGALVRRGHQVVVGDRRPLETDDDVSFVELDVMDEARLTAACAGVDAVLNFVGPYYRYGDRAAVAAMAAGRPYVDVCDDADVTEHLLSLDSRAKGAGVAMIAGAGMSPGVLNAMAQVASIGFDEIDEIVTAWVVSGSADGGSAPLDHFFRAIHDPIPVWSEGRRQMIDPFQPESALVFPFPDPVGSVEVRDVGHPETVTLPRSVPATNVRNKGAVLPARTTLAFSVLSAMGLTSEETVVVGGVEVIARDFLVAFLTQRRQAEPATDEPERSGIGARVTGRRAGVAATRHVAFGQHLSMAEATSLPAVAAIELVLAGAVPHGFHGPEVLTPSRWFPALADLADGRFDHMHLWDDDSTARIYTLVGLADVATQQPTIEGHGE